MSRYFRFLNRSSATRRGVTLLEVIVAMGVLVVGLMGMISLIPLGRLELAEGDRLDNSSTLGRAAFRELTVRGYLNPQMWAHPVSGVAVATTTGYVFNGTPPEHLPPFAPIVIDPLMCAPRFLGEGLNALTLTNGEQSHRDICKNFPYSVNLTGTQNGWPEETMPRFARATLRSYPINASRTVANSPAHLMRFDVASRMFRSSDDLVIDLPLDRVRRPVQVFGQSELTNLTVTAYDGVITETAHSQIAYRKFKGDYSWFFIVQPNNAERWCTDAMMPNGGGSLASPYTTKAYRVWVVVCNKRDYRDTSEMNLATDRAVGERCVWIDFVDRYTARLRVIGVADEGTAIRLLDVKPNHWVAAASYFGNEMLGPGAHEYVLEWFRIVNASDRATQVPGTDIWFREISLAGPDVTSPTASSLGVTLTDRDVYEYPDLGLDPTTAWGVLIPGVRGVYEKSVYADRPSLWAPQ